MSQNTRTILHKVNNRSNFNIPKRLLHRHIQPSINLQQPPVNHIKRTKVANPSTHNPLNPARRLNTHLTPNPPKLRNMHRILNPPKPRSIRPTQTVRHLSTHIPKAVNTPNSRTRIKMRSKSFPPLQASGPTKNKIKNKKSP